MHHIVTSIQHAPQPLSDDTVVAIISADLPHMSCAQLADLLTNLCFAPPSAITTALVPLARAELARRRIIEEIEALV
jgi:hypothetical protein